MRSTYNDCRKVITLYRAVSNPLAEKVIRHLIDNPDNSAVSDIVKATKHTSNRVSETLARLRRYGLVFYVEQGPRHLYCIDMDEWKQVYLANEKLLSLLNKQ